MFSDKLETSDARQIAITKEVHKLIAAIEASDGSIELRSIE